ncbi:MULTISPECIES: hypothetical protein [Streptomyces]|uniref:hypothetical protein n=1 Tax=Streptomyces TaxID=1883 RepID=UPI001F228AC6|nr:hypothetical protein [Streptomyces noursei]MCE4948664.1 hypothetical protein [Streptomyces noursei]
MRFHRATAALMVCAGAALATATMPASASAATTPPTGNRVAVIDCTGNAQHSPGTFMLACGDGNNVLTSLRWSQWHSRSAVAEGTDMVNDCRPYCAAGHFHGYPVRVRLDTPQARTGHDGQRHFTRVTLTYPADRPADTARVVTLNLWS